MDTTNFLLQATRSNNLSRLLLDKKKKYITNIVRGNFYLKITKKDKTKLLKTGGEAIVTLLKQVKIKKLCVKQKLKI